VRGRGLLTTGVSSELMGVSSELTGVSSKLMGVSSELTQIYPLWMEMARHKVLINFVCRSKFHMLELTFFCFK
jgi:hypothetical protein